MTTRTSATTTQISTQRGHQRSDASLDARRAPLQRGGLEALGQALRRAGLGRSAARRVGEPAHDARGSAPPSRNSVEADRAVALGEALAVGAEQQRDVRVRRRRAEAEQRRSSAIWRAVEASRSSPRSDMGHALRRVVHHDGQLVGDDAVGPAHHDVAARRAQRSRCGRAQRRRRTRSSPWHAKAQRGLLAPLRAARAACAGERGRCPGSAALGAVRRRCGRAHVGARAEALVEEPALLRAAAIAAS